VKNWIKITNALCNNKNDLGGVLNTVVEKTYFTTTYHRG